MSTSILRGFWIGRAALRGFWIGMTAFVVAFAAVPAAAAPSGHGARIAIRLPGGERGPLVLRQVPGGWLGEFAIDNAGTEPLTVSRVALQGDEDDVRSPSRLSVRFVDGAPTSAVIAPGASKSVVVSWMPDRASRMQQAFGQVVATSNDEESGEVAMGFQAQLPTGFGWAGAHVLSLLVVGPLLIVLIVAVARALRRGDARPVRALCIVVAVLEFLVAAWAYHRCGVDVGRADGNEGFQLVERAVWIRSIASEWYVGVDGTSVPLMLLAAAVEFVAVLVACAERRRGSYLAALALLCAGIMGAIVALDLVVLFAACEVVWLALVLLVGGWGGPRAQLSAAKVGVAGIVASSAMLLAFAALSHASGPTFLVDGTIVPHTLAIPELSRTAFLASPPILGMPMVEVAWVLLFVAVAIFSPVVPFHRWLPDALEQAPPAAGIVLGGTAVALGPYLLVRLGLGAVPEGARWAGGCVATLGALAAAWGSLCAMVQHDLRRFVAYTTVATSGIALYGVGALTPVGIAGGMVALVAHGLSAVLVLGCAAALDQRVHTCDVGRLGGLVVDAPALRALAAVGLAVSLGAPGLAGSWSIVLALLGGFVRYPALAVVIAFALIASAAAHLRIGRRLLTGQADPRWRDSAQLAPYGGRLPDAAPHELIALVPTAAVAFLLGVWPSPVLASMAVGARDCSAAVDPDGPEARLQRGD